MISQIQIVLVRIFGAFQKLRRSTQTKIDKVYGIRKCSCTSNQKEKHLIILYLIQLISFLNSKFTAWHAAVCKSFSSRRLRWCWSKNVYSSFLFVFNCSHSCLIEFSFFIKESVLDFKALWNGMALKEARDHMVQQNFTVNEVPWAVVEYAWTLLNLN